MTPEYFNEFLKRLQRDHRGEGAKDHGTRDPIFIVEARKFIYGIDRDYTDDWAILVDDMAWRGMESYLSDLDVEGMAHLDAMARAEDAAMTFAGLPGYLQWSLIEQLEEHSVVGYVERWEYVNAHLTRESAEAFIKRKSHDYRDGLRVYVDSQVYCHEWREIVTALLDGRLILKEGGQRCQHVKVG